MKLQVDAAAGMLRSDGRGIACSIGRSGTIAAVDKREGDGATPAGRWPIRGVLLRPDRVDAPVTRLPWRWLRSDDGWSDDPRDPAYNRAVRHPHPFSAERLWRDDGLYDVIVLLGHNDVPPVAGKGSAIFLHCWNPGAATKGCVAVACAELVGLLPELTERDAVEIA